MSPLIPDGVHLCSPFVRGQFGLEAYSFYCSSQRIGFLVLLIFFLLCFLLIYTFHLYCLLYYLKSKFTERKDKERDFASTGWFPRRSRQPELGQPKARSLEFSGLPCRCRSPRIWSSQDLNRHCLGMTALQVEA